MNMFTSYGHTKKPKLNHRFFYDFSLSQSLKSEVYNISIANKSWLVKGDDGSCKSDVG